MSDYTIEELVKQVPLGEARLFESSGAPQESERFFVVRQNWDYEPGRLDWLNKPRMAQGPWYGNREIPRTSVSEIPKPEVIFAGPAKKLVDFYSTSTAGFFLSEKLVALIEAMDPGSLDCVPISIKCKDAELPFLFAMPLRTLEAIDPIRTAILIRYDDLAGTWFRRIEFPQGIAFKNADLAAIHSFADLDAHGWYWSRELIDAAKGNGIKGLRTVSLHLPDGNDIDRL
jgi:hypothetical protein